MKVKQATFFILIALNCASPLIAASDPCVAKHESDTNAWIFTINQNDVATREDLLNTFRLFGSKGFAPISVFGRKNNAVTIGFQFNPRLFRSVDEARQQKESILHALSEIPETKLECAFIGQPGMGVSTKSFD